jgi:hypothetical protein
MSNFAYSDGRTCTRNLLYEKMNSLSDMKDMFGCYCFDKAQYLEGFLSCKKKIPVHYYGFYMKKIPVHY